MTARAGAERTARPGAWRALALLSLVLFGNYYVYDSIGPVADLLQRELGFSDRQIGTLNAIYSLPNVVLTLVGGWLIDRFGAGRIILWFTGICLLGALLTAVGSPFPVMAAGRLLFGVGSETMINATIVATAYWFADRQLAFAMAVTISLARLGSWSADLSTILARPLYDQGWQPPLLLALVLAALSFGTAVAYRVCERRGVDARHIETPAPVTGFRRGELAAFGFSYWSLVGLCVTFYAVILAFRSTFAIKYFQHAHAQSLQQAGLLNSYVFLATVVATPLFGWLSDRIGRRSLLLMAGAALLPASFAVLGATGAPLWVSTAMVGSCYALVPAVLWPATALIVPRERLGLAFGAMTVLQNLGITMANFVAGSLNDHAHAGSDNPGGYDAMLWFFGLASLAGFLFAALLWSRRHSAANAILERPAGASGPARA